MDIDQDKGSEQPSEKEDKIEIKKNLEIFPDDKEDNTMLNTNNNKNGIK